MKEEMETIVRAEDFALFEDISNAKEKIWKNAANYCSGKSGVMHTVWFNGD